MQRYIAFISGLPAGRGAIEADNIRILFSRLGFLNVEPFPTPDTVIFDTAPVGVIAPLAAQISRHLNKSLGISVWTFIRTAEEVDRIVANVPFPDEDVHHEESSLFVILLSDELDERTEKQLRLRRGDQDQMLHVSGREIYWLRRDNDAEPLPLAEILNAPATVRSLKTLIRVSRYEPEGNGWPSRPSHSADTTQSERSHQ